MKLDVKFIFSIGLVVGLLVVNVTPELVSHFLDQVKRIMEIGGLPGLFIFMVLQSVIAVIPAEAVLMLSGSTFGAALSSIVGTMGLMCGAMINYFVGFEFGRPIVEKLISKEEIIRIEEWFKKHGTKIIFIARFIPLVSFDAISYFSGIAGIAVVPFMIATFLGTIPRAIFYSYLGEKVGESVRNEDITALNYLLLAFLLVTVISIILSMKEKHNGSRRA